MSAKLTATKDYKLFELTDFNRDIGKTADLEKSMRTHGYLPAYPLHVVRNGNGRLRVKAGHHRLHVASKLGIPVYYVVCDDNATVHELERGTNKWILKDYLDSFCRLQYPAYLKVRDYYEQTGICLQQSIALLAGDTATSSSNRVRDFQAGVYQTGNCGRAEVVRQIVEGCKEAGILWATHNLFVSAISRMSFLPEFDGDTFIVRAKANPGMLIKQPTLDAYCELIERVYNYKAHTKFSLAIPAKEAARLRCAVVLPTKK